MTEKAKTENGTKKRRERDDSRRRSGSICDSMYRIPLSSLSHNELTAHKAKLTMTPSDSFRESTPFNAFVQTTSHLCVPRYYGLHEFGPAEKDGTDAGESISSTFRGTLKPHQVKATSSILEECGREDRHPNGGMLVIGCGMGKTVCGIYVAMSLGVRTLVLVHKGFLMDQWAERIRQFTDATVGYIRQDREDKGKDITIAMIQSICKRTYDLTGYGLLIVDEAHHVAAPLFKEAIFKVASRHVLSLSATPERRDGLTRLLYHSMGGILYAQERPPEVVHVRRLIATQEKRREIVGYDGRPNYARMLNQIASDTVRTRKVASYLLSSVLKEGRRRLLVLSDRINHLESLHGLLLSSSPDLPCGFYIGRSTEEEREEAEKKTVILSTYCMAREGLDFPFLDTLVLLSPIGDVTQAVGRILRHQEGKADPLVVDVTDDYSLFLYMSKKRLSYYTKQDYLLETLSLDAETLHV